MVLATCSMVLAMAMTAAAVTEPARSAGTPVSTAAVTATADAPSLQTLSSQALTLRPERLTEAWMQDRTERRPAALPALYAALGAMQAFDVYSTRRAVGAGAHEVNPIMRKSAGNSGAMLAMKAASTVGTIYFAERAWKKSRTGSIILMAAINGATAAIATRNLRNAK